MNETDLPHPDSILYDLPGGPVHPADVVMSEIRHERRMQEIREMDIEKWVAEIRR